MEEYLLIAEGVVIQYPTLCTKSAELQYLSSDSLVTQYGDITQQKSRKKRITEHLALQELTPTEMKMKNAVETVKLRTLMKKWGYFNEGIERIEVIYLRYWDEGSGHSISCIMEKTDLQYAQIISYIDDFLRMISEEYEIHPCQGCVSYRELMLGLNACHYVFDFGHMRSNDADGNCLQRSYDTATLEDAWWFNGNHWRREDRNVFKQRK